MEKIMLVNFNTGDFIELNANILIESGIPEGYKLYDMLSDEEKYQLLY